jgi:hypothetical protein
VIGLPSQSHAQLFFRMSKSDSSTKVRSSRSLTSIPRFQFSLAKLMIAMAVVAVLLFVVTKVGSFVEIVLFSFVACVVPTPLVICAIYGRGDVRAFAIGALNPWVVSIALRFPDPYGTFFEMIWLVVMGGICGVLAVITRRWIWRDRE